MLYLRAQRVVKLVHEEVVLIHFVCVICALFNFGRKMGSRRRQLLLHHFTLFSFSAESKGGRRTVLS